MDSSRSYYKLLALKFSAFLFYIMDLRSSKMSAIACQVLNLSC
jgi:hypothetical protein